jgi:diguanylate cyclase (GGDEF)-like protein
MTPLDSLTSVIKQLQTHQVELENQKEKLYATEQQVENIKKEFSEIKRIEKQLIEMAHYDVLTGLPNRAMLVDRLKQDIARAQRQKTIIGVLFFDLDKFKEVNDEYGHIVGDKVLKTISNNVYNAIREVDTIARIGGDEFIIVLVDLENEKSCIGMINRILDAAAAPIIIDTNVIKITASIGITFYEPTNPIEIEILISQADKAMYQAKQLGKNRYCMFEKIVF